MSQSNPRCVGIDVSKATLDIAGSSAIEQFYVGNDGDGELLANLVYGDQATFRSDASWICSPFLNWTLFTTRVNRSNPLILNKLQDAREG